MTDVQNPNAVSNENEELDDSGYFGAVEANPLMEKYLDEGINLEPYGLVNVLVDSATALRMIADARAAKLVVIGGDVYQIVDGKPKISDDNWSCDKRSDETDADYVERSAAVAEDYIEHYRGVLKPYFAIDISE